MSTSEAQLNTGRELEAGREMDAAVHRLVMQRHRPPSRDYAAAKVGSRYIAQTGGVFHLTTGDKLPMPAGDTLRQPEGSDCFNDRYCLRIAEFLGDRIAAEVDAFEMPAPPYSTDWNAAALVAERLPQAGLTFKRGFYDEEGPRWGVGCTQCADWILGRTLPEAICRAALEFAAPA